ncbi:hypothetical protein ACLQ3C_05880 [Gordonia sp. DT30]|uniref:hypothetical protein n=1 Tax=Gordonia sp. DT30 TaxID=3416546 RepID=UPI003CF892F7
MAAPHVTHTEEEMPAAVAAGHEMAGMALTDRDEAAVRRVLRGETTATEEADRLAAEIIARRTRR